MRFYKVKKFVDADTFYEYVFDNREKALEFIRLVKRLYGNVKIIIKPVIVKINTTIEKYEWESCAGDKALEELYFLENK